MKPKTSAFFSASKLALAAVISLSASAMAAYEWNITTSGNWDTTSENWAVDGTKWVNGTTSNALFAKDPAAVTVTLSEAITAGSVMVGNGGNNANYTFTNGTGGSLTASSFTVQGAGGADFSNNPTTKIQNATLNLGSGDLGIRRANLVIEGSSTVNAANIVGNDAWGQLTIKDNANVVLTGGINGNSTAWGINLDGGTLTTGGINYGPHSYNGVADLKFNGTLVKANTNNGNFITATGGFDFNPKILAGGAKFDTNGNTIGIGVALEGEGALTKSGSGTLDLNVASSYTGNTTVNGGILSLNHEPTGIANTAIGAMTSSNTVTINNGGTLTGTKNNWLSNTTLSSGVGGLNAISVVVKQGSTLKGGTGTISGLGNVTLDGSTIEVTNGLGNYGWNASFTLGGDITVSGSTASYIKTSSESGTGATANIYMSDGSNGTGGNRTFTVNDVTSATSDLIVSAQLAKGTVTKKGDGTLELAAGATGTEAPVSWQVNNGKLLVNANVTTGGVTVASGSTLGGSGTVGAVTIDSGAFISPGNSSGTLNTGNYNQAGTLTLELNGITAGTQHDQINVTGSVNLSVNLSGILSASLGYTPVNGDLLFILLNDGADAVSGTFAGLADDSTFMIGGYDWKISYNADSGTNAFNSVTGNDIALIAIPEPGAALLGGLGLLALLRRRR